MEIEKKYTIKNLPDNLSAFPCRLIEQAYLNTDPVIRIRKEDENYYLTYKGKGLIAREEYNLPLNYQSYNHLLEKADGNVISKKRYLIPFDLFGHSDQDLIIELDIFDPPFAPLILAEVEFPNLESAHSFQAPDWFYEDVSLDPRYHNATMSRLSLEEH